MRSLATVARANNPRIPDRNGGRKNGGHQSVNRPHADDGAA
ncbi:hypothetical protein [Pseudomonas sp. EL_65y_Pfl2_R95]